MSITPQDMGDQWQGVEPEQPPSSRAAFWVTLVATLLLLIGALALAAFLLSQHNSPTDDTTSELDMDPAVTITSPGTESTASQVGGTETEVITIAPTVTLPGQRPESAQPTAVQLSDPPDIDSRLDEWSGVPIVSSNYLVYRSSVWDGSDDLIANWQLAWDNEHLYLAATVIDDIHVQNQTGNTIFRGDSLDIQIDTNRSDDFGPSLSPDDFQITFSPGDFAGLPPSAFRFQGTSAGEMLDAAGLHGIRVAAQSQPDGYILEAAIPWRDLNTVPATGMIFGLALNATDNDEPGTAVQEIMKSSAANRAFGDPTTWGTLVLQ